MITVRQRSKHWDVTTTSVLVRKLLPEMWECKWWEKLKTINKIKKSHQNLLILQNTSFNRLTFSKIKYESIFGYVQSDLLVPDKLKLKFVKFAPVFKNTAVGGNDIGDFVKNFTIENNILKHSQRKLISSFKLKTETVITPLSKLYLKVGLQCTKT